MDKIKILIIVILLILLIIFGFYFGRNFLKKEKIQVHDINIEMGVVDQIKENSIVFKFKGDPALGENNFITKEYYVDNKTKFEITGQIKTEEEYRKEEAEYNLKNKQKNNLSTEMSEPPIWFKLLDSSFDNIKKGDEVKVYYIKENNQFLASKIIKFNNFSNELKNSDAVINFIKKENYFGQISEIDHVNNKIKINIKSLDNGIDPGVPDKDTIIEFLANNGTKITDKVNDLKLEDLKINQSILIEAENKEGILVALNIEKL